MRYLLALLSAVPLLAFEYQPWFYQAFEFQFRPGYTWRHYSDVDNGFNPTSSSSTDQAIDIELQVSPWWNWDVQAGINFADTRMHSWSYLSTAAMARYLLLDDIAGDLLSVTLGAMLRSASGHFLDDVSIPYHANLNLELHSAVGKEFDRLYDWVFRLWGVLGAGIGNRGAPWIRGDAHFEGNVRERHIFELFADSQWGLGGRDGVNVRNFHSYANIDYSAIDVGLLYRYRFTLWGALSFSYAYRAYAKNFPEDAHTLHVDYRLPFSLF